MYPKRGLTVALGYWEVIFRPLEILPDNYVFVYLWPHGGCCISLQKEVEAKGVSSSLEGLEMRERQGPKKTPGNQGSAERLWLATLHANCHTSLP